MEAQRSVQIQATATDCGAPCICKGSSARHFYAMQGMIQYHHTQVALGTRAAPRRLQHPSGYAAALDPWLGLLWAALGAAHPLPPGVPEVRSGKRRLFTNPCMPCAASLDPEDSWMAWSAHERGPLPLWPPKG